MAKGFKRNGKFIPITDYNKKGTRKSRDQDAKTEGIRMERITGMRKDLDESESVETNIQFMGTDGKLHDLIRLKDDESMSNELRELVLMNKPREKKEYHQIGYKIKGSRLFYHRSRSSIVENREQELKNKKALWALLFEKGRYKLIKTESFEKKISLQEQKNWDLQEGQETITIQAKYNFVVPHDDYFSSIDADQLRQEDFDRLGIDPTQFVVTPTPDDSKLDESLRSKRREWQEWFNFWRTEN